MTAEERIAHLEAEVSRLNRVIEDQARAMREHAEREAAESAKREARRRVNRQNYERRKAKATPGTFQTSDSDRIQTSIQTIPSSPLCPPSPSSEPSPSSPLYPPFSPENPAAPTAAIAASPTIDDIPDATDDAHSVDERPALVLVTQKPQKPSRKPSKAEALFARLEARREEMCREHGLDFVPTRSNWPAARINRDLGPIAREEESDGPEWQRFRAAWWEFLSDPNAREADVPYSLDWFWKARDRYYGRSLRAAGVAQ